MPANAEITQFVTIKEHSLEKAVQKTKVLFIGPYPPPYSGPEMGMKLLLESSLKESFQIYFLNTNVRKTNVNKGRLDHHMVWAFFRFIFRLVFMIVRHRPVVAYYPVTATQIGWVGRDLWCLFICRLFALKTIIHLRGGHFKLNFERFHPMVKKLVSYACNNVSMAIVQAECLKNQFFELMPESKIEILYNAIDTEEYNNEQINDYDHRNILFMGHMTKAKGYIDLVRSIPSVAKVFPNVRFYFAGTLRRGEKNVFFNQLTGAPIQHEDPFLANQNILLSTYRNNYKNLGIISGELKKNILQKTNMVVLPSYSEGFSRVILEALSMGKPVICTPVGAHKEIIKDGVNGFLVRPGDVKQLANRIIALLSDDDLRRKIAMVNSDYVRKNFDISKIAVNLEHHINKLTYDN